MSTRLDRCEDASPKFDAEAANYERYASVQRNVAAWCAEWIEPSPDGLAALELGAGTGLFTRHLARYPFRSLLATDVSPEMVRHGRKNVQDARWELHDAWSPTMDPVDRLYSSSLLQWAPEPERVLSTWRRLLLPGGRALLCAFVRGSLAEWEAARPGFSAVRFRSPDEWLDALTCAGYTIRRADTCHLVERYGTALEAVRHLHRTGVTVAHRMSGGELRAFLRTLDEQQEGDVRMSWSALRVEVD